MPILNKQQRQEKKDKEEKIMDLVLKKNITYLQAKEIIEQNQSSLSDFKF